MQLRARNPIRRSITDAVGVAGVVVVIIRGERP